MRLHRLEIENLNSLQGRHVLDFDDQLGGAPLFLIHGETGSGKSTLLDAIALALFGRTARLGGRTRDQKKLSDILEGDIGKPTQTMSWGTAQCMAALTFSLPNETGGRETWRFTWQARRAHRRPDGKVQDELRTFERLDTPSEVVATPLKLQRDIQEMQDRVLRGMTWETFSRTVMLAQGEFARLLRGTPAEREQVLKQLVDSEDFARVGRNVATLRSDADAERNALRQQLGVLQGQVLPPDEEARLRQDTDVLETRARDQEALLKQILSVEQQLQQAWEARQQADRLRRQASDADQACREAAPERQRADLAGKVLPFLTLDREAADATRGVDQAAAQHDDLQAQATAQATLAHQATEAHEATQRAVRAAEEAREVLSPRLDEARQAWQAADLARQARDRATLDRDGATARLQAQLDAEQAAVLDRTAAAEALEARRRALDALARRDDITALQKELQNARREDGQLAGEEVRGASDLARITRQQDELQEAIRAAGALQAQHTLVLQTLQQEEAEAHQRWEQGMSALGLPPGETPDWDALLEAGEREQRGHDAWHQRWELLTQADARARTAADEAEGCARQTADADQALQDAERARIEAESAHEATLQALRTLDLADRAAALRDHLREGEPCPVCGSTEHPAPAATPGGGAAREDLERQSDADRLALQAADRRRDSASSALAAAQALHHAADERAHAATAQVEAARQALGPPPPGLDTTHVDPHAWPVPAWHVATATAWQKRRSHMQELRTLDTTRATYTLRRQTLDGQIADAAGREEQARAALRALTDEALSLTDAQARLHARRRSLAQRMADRLDAVELGVVADRVAAILPRDVWTDTAWAGLEEALEAWQQHHEVARLAVDEATATLQRMEERCSQLEAQVEEARGLAEAACQAADHAEAAHRAADERRLACLEGRPPDDVDQESQQRLRLARTAEAEARKAREDAAQSLQALQLAAAAARANLDAAQRHADAANAKALEWLTAHPEFSKRDSAIAASLPADDLAALTDHLRQLDDARTRTATLAEQARTAFTKARATLNALSIDLLAEAWRGHWDRWLATLDAPVADDDTPLWRDAIDEARHAREQVRYEALTELGQAQARLAASARVQAQAGALLARQRDAELQMERWSAIHRLIGVNDGEGFQRQALALRLEEIVYLANQVLETLAPRYLLQVPQQEGLPLLDFVVVDRHQADRSRDLATLSGGETFLVSLGLALGLAGFQRSTLPVETLLIDEGFGTLDPETLRVAISTLESLHASRGGMIGLVSHVQELVGRIPARVHVRRSGQGRSVLEVHGPG